jgi:hypothetical protein
VRLQEEIKKQEAGLAGALVWAWSKKWIILLISAAMIAPCVWHREIEAGDLPSHVYNAWLAQLIGKGQAPGLYIVRQWNNVLFDWSLLHAANLLGIAAAEKIVVAACVLIFFWGAFGLMAAVAGRAPWFLAPCIAMLAYGFSFSMGFLNYYLSLGLACISLAVLWRGRGWEKLLGAALAPVVLLAHLLGFLWLTGTLTYVSIWRRLTGWWKLILPGASVAGLCGVWWYFAYRVHFPVSWPDEPLYFFTGADQLVLYGERYEWLMWAALALGVSSVVIGAIERGSLAEKWKKFRLPVELYAITFLGTSVLPDNLHPAIYSGWIGFVVSRLTSVSAILGLCVLGLTKPRKWHLVGFGGCAAIFFLFLFQDTGFVNRLEANAQALVNGLPFGTRVVPTIFAPENSRIEFIEHVLDRACIEHCFNYANYEPSSGEFRIRVRPDSPVVTDSTDDSSDMEYGNYVVQGKDLPIMEIYQCDEKDLAKLCLRSLAAGEKNGRLGYRPPPD